VSLPAPRRVLRLLWRAGGGVTLILPVMQVIALVFVGGMRDRGRFVISPNSMLLTALTPMVIGVWAMVTQYHVRLMVSVTEIRVPQVFRLLCFTMVALAAWTVFELLTPIVVLHGPGLQWLLFVFFAICSGILAALFRSTYLETPIWLVCLLLVPGTSASSRDVSLTWVEIAAVVLPVLIAWRLQVIIRAFRAGSHGDFFRSFAIEAWGGVQSTDSITPGAEVIRRLMPQWLHTAFGEGGRPRPYNVDRSSRGTFRVCLESSHQLGLSWILGYLVVLPMMGLLGSHLTAAEILDVVKYPVSFGVPILGGFLLLTRVRRLADLLGNPSGEIADLALLPGLGDREAQKRALLEEALIRPLIYYGLCLSGLLGLGWVLPQLSQQPIDPLFLAVPSAAVLILLLFAMLIVGVLSGKVDRGSRWLDWAMIQPVCFFGIASISSLPRHDCIPALTTWPSIAWGVLFAAMVGLLTRWGIQLNRRQNLLCR
jgi:hypothetical protein